MNFFNKIVALFLLAFTVSVVQAEDSKTQKDTEGATWDSETRQEQGATWNTKTEPVFYLFAPYHGQGPWVETPGRVFGAVGVIPGTVVGAVVAVPLLPFVDFEKTVLTSNTFFGQGFSMILASPFYATKLIFWDVPKSWFE